ncbi:MAG: hypothetical protein HW387_548 [Parachlamydiales bacterium]|nr:hypothetical protein [Parachlamydiales bacterium]
MALVLFAAGAVFLFQSRKNALQVIEENGSKRSPHIMLFTCQYGSGHKMATQSIVESLPDCDVRIVDIYADPLAPIDPMRSWAPSLSNEHVYNQWIKKERNLLLNISGKIAPKFLQLQRSKIEELLTHYISKDKPDMIISCVPLVNFALLSVADELNIPLLVITTDIDISAFCFNLPEDLELNRSHFRMTVPYEQLHWDKLFSSRFSQSLRNSFQYSFGYPTRPAFSKNPGVAALNQIRDEYEIKNDENVVLIMMGGNAGQAARTYAELLTQMSDEELDRIVGKDDLRNKLHTICLCGDTHQSENRDFMESLNALNRERTNHRVRIHGCPGTPKIAELISLPELRVVISKPGGSTVNEMIKKKVPMIYHSQKHPLDWEKGNMEYGESRGLGKRFLITNHSFDDLSALTDRLAESFILSKAMQSGAVPVPEADIDFASNLRRAVQEMLLPKPTK